jgi:hypothetical protein
MKQIVCSAMLLCVVFAAQAQQAKSGPQKRSVFEKPEEIYDCPDNRAHPDEVLLMTVPANRYSKKVKEPNGTEKWVVVETPENRQSVIDNNFGRCPYRTKRLGRARADNEGGVYSNQVPVFVKKSERDSVLQGLKKL